MYHNEKQRDVPRARMRPHKREPLAGGGDIYFDKSMCRGQLNILLPSYKVRIIAPPTPVNVPSNFALPALVPRFGFSNLQD